MDSVFYEFWDVIGYNKYSLLLYIGRLKLTISTSGLLVVNVGGGAANVNASVDLDGKGKETISNISPNNQYVLKDTRGHWAENSINDMYNKGVVSGFPDCTFRPDDRVTIEQFAAMMLRSLWEKGQDAKLHWAQAYLDRISPMDRYYLEQNAFDLNNIPEAKNWSTPYLKQLENMRFFYSYDDPFEGKLDSPLTREVAAFMLRNFLEQTEYAENRNYAKLALQGIKDASNVDPSLNYDVELSLLDGMMRGYPDGTFHPKGFITRAEATFIVDRLLNRATRDPYKPDVSQSYYTSYETDRGIKYVVFNSKEIADVWGATVNSIAKTQGYAFRSGGVTYHFYKDKATRDAYQRQEETELFNFSIANPFDLSLGISASERDYFIAKDVTSANASLHESVYNDFVAVLFGSSATDFNTKFNQFGEDYKKDKSIIPRDYMIGSRSIRLMQEGTNGKIIAFILEKN